MQEDFILALVSHAWIIPLSCGGGSVSLMSGDWFVGLLLKN